MGSFLNLAVMANNYSHDIATALLAASALTLWIISRTYPASAAPDTESFFVKIYLVITKTAKYSLLWILVAGVPRIIFYKKYEWSDMAGDFQVLAIIVKHIVMFFIVGTGLFYWSRLHKKVKSMQLKRR